MASSQAFSCSSASPMAFWRSAISILRPASSASLSVHLPLDISVAFLHFLTSASASLSSFSLSCLAFLILYSRSLSFFEPSTSTSLDAAMASCSSWHWCFKASTSSNNWWSKLPSHPLFHSQPQLVEPLAERADAFELLLELLQLPLLSLQLVLELFDGRNISIKPGKQSSSPDTIGFNLKPLTATQLSGRVDLVTVQSHAHLAHAPIEGQFVGHIQTGAHENSAHDVLHGGLEDLVELNQVDSPPHVVLAHQSLGRLQLGHAHGPRAHLVQRENHRSPLQIAALEDFPGGCR
eukprot:maker-scaffold907_size82601-snap-gene-0.30 protein:Tk01578 transcript:maker-scaffold907_size82601-snap-gene-0.30-mRNA-1 annotation:"multispecies: udp-galactose-lipid carrier transferase"